ncbi:polyadenylate-binding protein-interacting protein 1-like [Brevipalpus obovatus]|uniref:polyadenylate-binding protein-interacting protein 1-like n=1 Tax=Brevipalpus obovatus TaxID=246614 RepID=UPI003D9E2D65
METAAKDSVSRIRLNPEAKEFVPRFSVNLATIGNQQQQQQQSTIVTSSGINGNQGSSSSTSSARTPYINGTHTNQWNGDMVSSSGGGYRGDTSNKHDDDSEPDDYVALCELKEFIDLISFNPARYEDRVGYITDLLNSWYEEDPDTILECTVNLIVDQAILDPNFRYNGVRFCVHLISNFKVTTAKGTFKDILLQRCQREHSRRDALIRAQTSDYFRGVALFIADLSTRIEEPDLMDAVPELLLTLLSRTTTDNVKCACNILKLCGRQIDEHLSRKGSQDMEPIFDRLSMVQKQTQTPNLPDLIKNIIELRSNGWQARTAPPSNLVNPYANGPIYEEFECGPAPPVEVNQFNQPGYQHPYYNSDPTMARYDFGPCEDQYDDNVCHAFEEFLRQSGQI